MSYLLVGNENYYKEVRNSVTDFILDSSSDNETYLSRNAEKYLEDTGATDNEFIAAAKLLKRTS